MAHLLSMEDVGITLGSRPILGDITLGLDDGARVGVVGPNGGGKSTLLRLITGELEADNGRVTRTGGLRAAVLSQRDELADTTVRAAIHGTASEHEWASERAIRELHAGLIPDVDLDRGVNELSGGQRRRVALCSVLTADADLIILDEPTNHLDVDGVDYLHRYLTERFSRGRGALVTVTHDRWFLDAVCERMWEVVPGNDGAGGRSPQPGRVEQYEGGYAAYVLARAERERQRTQAESKRANLLRKELAWLRRGAPARTSKPKFRIEAANELIADEPAPRDRVELTKMATARLGKDVIDLEDVSFSYGERSILEGTTLRLGPGERLGIVGANGSGKSTLLGLIAGRLQPTGGRVKRGKTVQLAELSQHTSELDAVGDMRVVESVSSIATSIDVGGKEMTASQLVERLGFTRERAWTEVSRLSGGERRRLQLIRLLMASPNVLLMDEPTNDLDTDTLSAIEDLLDDWPGTLVVISHDRYLLERITDHQVAVMEGQVRHLPGGIDEYLTLRAAQEVIDDIVESGPEPTVSDAAIARTARKTMARVERQLTREREALAKIQDEQVVAALDFERLAKLTDEAARIQQRIDDLEEEWLWAAEQAD
ncbi:ABC-F family ATP-binding cassette domain-containing protein [Flaviflexus salsibiostraticola]|uniref:ABC-F family ATP-binding cassette domain-containing protein n=1 Tax=Flaviflexus salsibiostraticola TaxID=1282737 RepID=A0A3S8ZB14_9ACTO|nr:ABC-F family ATP-binding cassette domain-containing protein [Flaviflexus salsibiostraticola]AZN30667.1 ABC-F family ATP-binding cassette domain-containing protein [Flaviflexus salsibiostraticola]